MKKVLMAFVILSVTAITSAKQIPSLSPSNISQAVGIAPDSSARDTALQRAALDMIHKDYASAADIYRELLRETPNDAITWNRLGIAYHQQFLLGDALKCYERATKVDKATATAGTTLARCIFRRRNLRRRFARTSGQSRWTQSARRFMEIWASHI